MLRVALCLLLAVTLALAASPCQSTVRGKTYNLAAISHANG
jgi:hypothetical protein